MEIFLLFFMELPILARLSLKGWKTPSVKRATLPHSLQFMGTSAGRRSSLDEQEHNEELARGLEEAQATEFEMLVIKLGTSY